MWDMYNFLWAIPGIFFIYFYNKRIPSRSINLSGWPYLFLLVLIAIVTWLPSKHVVTYYVNQKCWYFTLLVISLSLIFATILFFIIQIKFILNWITIPNNDNFFNSCVKWENEEILLTLKNGKAYQGILLKYPENPKSRHNSQTISILPFKSGYRNNETKIIEWNIYYPKYKEQSNLYDVEIIIPRTEIVTFGKFNNEAFKYFEEQYEKQRKKRSNHTKNRL